MKYRTIAQVRFESSEDRLAFIEREVLAYVNTHVDFKKTEFSLDRDELTDALAYEYLVQAKATWPCGEWFSLEKLYEVSLEKIAIPFIKD